MKILIFTAIFGGYDVLKEQPGYPDTDYICFTDNPNTRTPGWRVIQCKTHDEHPRMSAKRMKCTIHRFIDNSYDYTIWIDGSMKLVHPEFIDTVLGSLTRWGFGLMRHPVGNCIYEEAKGCADMPKYQHERIMEQVLHYRLQGYPAQNGLTACGIIVRDMKRGIIHTIGEEWLYENLVWTFQDQLSLPYVLWKHSYGFDPIPIELYAREHFLLFNHASEE